MRKIPYSLFQSASKEQIRLNRWQSVPQEVLDLIEQTPSMNQWERQSCIKLWISMSPDYRQKFFDILKNQKERLEQARENYLREMRELNERRLQQCD